MGVGSLSNIYFNLIRSHTRNSTFFTIYCLRPGRRRGSNWVRHGGTAISYPQCSLTSMRERYLHRSFAYKLVPLLSTPCGTTGKDYCYDGCHWIMY